MRGEEYMVVVKLWSVRSMWEIVWRDAGLIGLSGGMIVRVERQFNAWLYTSASMMIFILLGR